jgi:molybdopterin synthase catalytic subunit
VPEFERQRYSNNALETRRQTGLNDKTKGAYGKGENEDAGISRVGLIGTFKIGKGSGMVNIACSHRQSAFLALREMKADSVITITT